MDYDTTIIWIPTSYAYGTEVMLRTTCLEYIISGQAPGNSNQVRMSRHVMTITSLTVCAVHGFS